MPMPMPEGGQPKPVSEGGGSALNSYLKLPSQMNRIEFKIQYLRNPLSYSDLTSHGSTYGQEVSVDRYRSLLACKANFEVP